MNHRRIFSIFLISLTTILACVIPGLQSAPESVPTADTGILSTMVAETVSAAEALTQQTFSMPTVVILTANAAVSQTAAVAPPVQASETLTPASIRPLVFSSYGTAIQKLGDAGTLYIDQIAGYQFIVSPGWTVIRPNEQEYFELWALPAASNPTVQNVLNNMKNRDSNVERVYGFDFRDDHIREDFIINFDVSYGKDLSGSYDDIFKGIKKIYSNTEAINKFTVLSSDVITTAENVEIGVIEIEIDGVDSAPDLKIYEKQVIIKVQAGGYFLIRFDTTYEFKDLTLAEFEQLIVSLKSYTP